MFSLRDSTLINSVFWVEDFFDRRGKKRRRCMASARLFNEVYRKNIQPKIWIYYWTIPNTLICLFF